MNLKNSAARAVADVSRGIILATVDVQAPPERVFRALTDPKEVPAWWGSPDTYRVTEFEGDLRVGGRWRSSGRGGDGAAFSVEGEYLEIDPPHRLVHTWRAPWDGNHSTTVRYQLVPIEGGTRITLWHEGFGDRAASCESHTDGWSRVLGWLRAHSSGPDARRAFFCRLLPPRPTFATDMTSEERAVMQAHAGYWTKLLHEGVAVAFGPVADPKGAWGAGILRVTDEAHVSALTAEDPAILSRRGFSYETLPMLSLVT